MWAADGRLCSVGLAGGPDAVLRTSPEYAEAAAARRPLLMVHGARVVVKAQLRSALRSVPLP